VKVLMAKKKVSHSFPAMQAGYYVKFLRIRRSCLEEFTKAAREQYAQHANQSHG
jgi:hypothetical protein